MIVVFVMTAGPSLAALATDTTPVCETAEKPLSAPPPKFPALLHNEFEGTAKVSFVVKQDGRVADVVIRSMSLSPVGHARREPVGYREAIVASVRQWRYPRRSSNGRRTVPIQVGSESAER